MIDIEINGQVMHMDCEDNSSVKALEEVLMKGPVTVQMRDYARMEKVGSLGMSLPTNDRMITTSPGDVILYEGDQLVIYYDTNTWDLTLLGRIKGLSTSELRTVLGKGAVTAVLSLA